MRFSWLRQKFNVNEGIVPVTMIDSLCANKIPVRTYLQCGFFITGNWVNTNSASRSITSLTNILSFLSLLTLSVSYDIETIFFSNFGTRMLSSSVFRSQKDQVELG